MQFGGSAGVTGTPLVAKYTFGTSLWGLAIIGMTGPLIYTVTCLALRSFKGRMRTDAIAITGVVIAGLTYVAAVWSTQTWHLVVACAGQGVGTALYWPMIEAFIARGTTGRKVSLRMGVFNISWSLGDAAGTAMGGFFFDLYPMLPFITMGLAVIPVAAVVIAAMRQPEENGGANGGEDGEGEGPADGATNDGFRKGAWTGNFIAAGVTNILRSVFAAPALDVFRMSGSTYGLVVGTFNATRTLTFYAMSRWHSWRYKARTFLAVNGLLAVGMAAVVAAAYMPHAVGVAVVFISFAAAGVGSGMTYFSSIFYTVDTHTEAETTTPIHEAVLGAGGAIAAIAAGVTNQLASDPLSPLAMCVVVVAVGMGISARCMRGQPRRDESRRDESP